MANRNYSIEFAKRWYGIHMPKKLDERLAIFAAKSLSLARQVKMCPIRVVEGVSAYIDKGVICIPKSYFSEEFYKASGVNPRDYAYAAVTCTNGSTVHEALHAKHSEVDIPAIAGKHPSGSAYLGLPGFVGILNISEDLFIEEVGRIDHPVIWNFIHDKNTIFFSEEELEKSANEFASKPSIDAAISCICTLKNVNLIDHPAFDAHPLLKQAAVLMERSRNNRASKADRVQTAIDVYDLFKSSGAVDMRSEMSSSGNIDQAASTESPNPGESMKEVEKNAKAFASKIAQIVASEFEHQIKVEMEVHGFPKHNSNELRLPKVKYIQASSIVRNRKGVVTLDRRYTHLGSFLRYAREMKHTPGLHLKSGSKLDKLALPMIGTDDARIMTVPTSRHLKRGKPEVIVLVDGSGSTRSGAKVEVNGEEMYRSLYEFELGAAFGILKSLSEVDIAVAVYVHTSDNEDNCSIYGVAANDMPLDNPKKVQTTRRPQELFDQAISVSSGENFDGVALDFVSHRFTDRDGSKLIVVLSDGYPAGPGYHGYTGIQHTSDTAKFIRRKGIGVISISVTEDVVETNSKIYGAEWNLAAYGANMNKQIDQMLRSLFS